MDESRSGVIYAVEYEDGIVKIGFTGNIQQRLYQLRRVYRGGEYAIKKIYVSGCVANVRKKEQDVLTGFAPALVGKRECFKIPFEVAVDKIKAICGEKYEIYASCIEDIMNDIFLCTAVNPTTSYEYHCSKLREAIRVYELSLEGT